MDPKSSWAARWHHLSESPPRAQVWRPVPPPPPPPPPPFAAKTAAHRPPFSTTHPSTHTAKGMPGTYAVQITEPMPERLKDILRSRGRG
jgi:hypothetical protein